MRACRRARRSRRCCSNIVLDELDTELARRGHRFVRYADDCNVYVAANAPDSGSWPACASFIQWRLRLRINAGKSAVARPEDRHFLGFSLRRRQHGRRRTVEVLLSRAHQAQRERHASASSRREPGAARWKAASTGSTRGCADGISSSGSPRPRSSRRCADSTPTSGVGCARSCCTTGNVNERSLGASSRWASSRSQRGARSTPASKSTWALSHTPAVDHGLRNAYFTRRGLVSVAKLHPARRPAISAPAHPTMALEQG